MTKRFNWADHACDRWCKVHFWWDFDNSMHTQYPQPVYWRQHDVWARCLVFIGPPAYFPKKPTVDQWKAMRMTCPHDQGDLTCNTCQRHTFRPREV